MESSCELFRDFYNIICDLLRGQVVRSLPQGKWGKGLAAGVGGLCAHLGVPGLLIQGGAMNPGSEAGGPLPWLPGIL